MSMVTGTCQIIIVAIATADDTVFLVAYLNLPVLCHFPPCSLKFER